jgi:hypothetical protein
MQAVHVALCEDNPSVSMERAVRENDGSGLHAPGFSACQWACQLSVHHPRRLHRFVSGGGGARLSFGVGGCPHLTKEWRGLEGSGKGGSTLGRLHIPLMAK